MTATFIFLITRIEEKLYETNKDGFKLKLILQGYIRNKYNVI